MHGAPNSPSSMETLPNHEWNAMSPAHRHAIPFYYLPQPAATEFCSKSSFAEGQPCTRPASGLFQSPSCSPRRGAGNCFQTSSTTSLL